MEQEGGIHHGWWQFKVMAVIIIIAFIGLCILLITPNHDPQIAINNVTSMNNGTIYAITTYYTGKPEVAWSECLGTVYYKNNSTNGKFIKATFAIREQVLVRWGEVDIQELCQ